MRTALTWILLILLAAGGIGGTYALSEAFRTDARQAWQTEASQVAQWLSTTVLGWLEESYTPLSGLAILFENSKEVTEVEFLGAADALEARATSFFLETKAVARPRPGGDRWEIEFSNDPMGPVSPDTPLSRHPVILETIDVAVDNPDQVMLGPPFSTGDGVRYSAAALAIQDSIGALVVIGLVNYDAIVKGLFDIHQLEGLHLQIMGRFQEIGGPGHPRVVTGQPFPEALHSVTTRTVSAGADLSITWYVNKQFSNGPQEALANFTLMGGIGSTILFVLLIGLLLQRNRTITQKVKQATDELADSRQRLDLALASSGIGTWDWNIKEDIVVWDDAQHRILGTEPAEMNRDLASLVKIIHPEDTEKVETEMKAALSEEKDFLSEYRFVRPDGEVRIQEARGHVIRNEDGQPLRMIGTGMDITERKQAEEALRKSEERFALTTSGSGDGLWDFDLPANVFWYSDRFRQLLGYRSEADYPNRLESWSDGLHPDDRETTLKAFTAHLERGEPYDVEYRLKTKQGKWRWFRARGKSLRDENGRSYRAAGSITDITEAKQMEQSIREKEARFRGYFEHSQVGMAVTSPTKGWVEANEQLQKMLGYTLEELRQMTWAELTHPEDIDADVQQFERMLAGKINHYVLDKRFIRKDGDIVYTNLTVSCIREETGDVFNVLASFQDITERKKMDDDLHERIKELDEAQSAMLNMMEDLDEEKQRAEAATRAKGDFLANMSHEIRTPMNAVIGMAHLALKTDLTPKQQDYLNKIQLSANSLLGIINDILDFSKIEAGKLDMEAVEFDLLETLDNVANVITVKAQEKENLEVLFYLDSQVPNFLVGDSLRLNQVLVNLGNNAVKFTEKGEIVITTKIVKKLDDKVTLQFSVRDTGIGMTEQQQKKLFQAFSQADTSTTRKYGGTGLGLTISKRLVNMMGGEIGIESEPGRGTTFIFTADFGLAKESVKRRFEPSPDLRGLKALVVDDNATSREILQAIMESFSFEVFLAASGQEALEEIESADKFKPFELVIMDWKMPGMDGIQASRRIKNHPKLNKIPAIVLVTAYGREEVMRQASDIGLDGFLLKPVNSSILFDAIMQALGRDVQEMTRQRQKKEQDDKQLSAIFGARVLLVEDNEINQQVALEILQGAGLDVSVANNGREGVEAATNGLFDVILMDIQMPVMDGYEATRRIRKWESVSANGDTDVNKTEARGQMIDDPSSPESFAAANRGQSKEGVRLGRWEGDKKSEIRDPKSEIQGVPIIAMTAHAMAGDEQKSLQAGMNGHVTKPIDPDQLFSTLQKWIKPAAERTADQKPSVVDVPVKLDSPVSDEEALPETLPGFDLAAGLGRLMGNKRLYKKLLMDFGIKYTETAREIREALDAKDFERVHGLVHNLKGLAGNLAANDLQAATVEMEKLVKGQTEKTASDKELNRKFAELANALNQALEAVHSLGPTTEKKRIESNANAKASIPPELVGKAAESIKEAADIGDVTRIQSIAKKLKSDFDALVPFCDELDRLAEDFDFEGIQKLVQELAS